MRTFVWRRGIRLVFKLIGLRLDRKKVGKLDFRFCLFACQLAKLANRANKLPLYIRIFVAN